MKSLFQLSLFFRNAIEEALKDGAFSNDINFQRFPYGCCGYASELLAKYLYENGINTLYVNGECGVGLDAQSHTWLESLDGFVIDITRDQFRNARGVLHSEDKVYVGPKDEFCKAFKPLICVHGFVEKRNGEREEENEVDKHFRTMYIIIQRYLTKS